MPTPKRKKKLVPAQVRTFAQLCSLPEDGQYSENYWWSLDRDGSEFCIYEQAMDCSPIQKIVIPKRIFNRMINWYLTGKKSNQVVKKEIKRSKK